MSLTCFSSSSHFCKRRSTCLDSAAGKEVEVLLGASVEIVVLLVVSTAGRLRSSSFLTAVLKKSRIKVLLRGALLALAPLPGLERSRELASKCFEGGV